MSLNRSKKYWEDMGDLDPYWAILTEPGTKYGTGSYEISCLTSAAERLGLPKHHDWALDLDLLVSPNDCYTEGWALTRYRCGFDNRIRGNDVADRARSAGGSSHSRPDLLRFQERLNSFPGRVAFPSAEVADTLVGAHRNARARVPLRLIVEITCSEVLR